MTRFKKPKQHDDCLQMNLFRERVMTIRAVTIEDCLPPTLRSYVRASEAEEAEISEAYAEAERALDKMVCELDEWRIDLERRSELIESISAELTHQQPEPAADVLNCILEKLNCLINERLRQRRDFPTHIIKLAVTVILKHYDGLCPLCKKVEIVNGSSQRTEKCQADHEDNRRENIRPENCLLCCDDCHQIKTSDTHAFLHERQWWIAMITAEIRNSQPRLLPFC